MSRTRISGRGALGGEHDLEAPHRVLEAGKRTRAAGKVLDEGPERPREGRLWRGTQQPPCARGDPRNRWPIGEPFARRENPETAAVPVDPQYSPLADDFEDIG